jgi:DNA-directed RNA polymerase sigma subunit (sigma70/sigma32)
MADQGSEGRLTEARKKEIFLAIVTAQDGDMTVAQSRQAISKQFSISESEVRQIEREGLDNGWPPL